MESRLPSRFNPVEFARNGEAGQFVLPVSHFKRFCALLSDDRGEVMAQANFYIGEGKKPIAKGRLDTKVCMVCQRCMKPMTIDISCEFVLAFVSTEDQAAELSESVDPVLMNEHNEIQAIDFLEDELILQLPMSSMHASISQCDASAVTSITGSQQTEPAKTHKPFSELGKLLKH